MSGPSYRVSIDRELCSGHGRCIELAPAVFRFDDEGLSVVRDDAVLPDLTAIQRVAALCPELAVLVETVE